MADLKIGIIGGSGLYRMEGLQDTVAHEVDTPFGRPSDKILTGVLDGVAVAFLARHGQEHTMLPSEVPYAANIFALKQLGVRYLLSLSATGSLQEQIAPLDMLVPDQYIDMTRKRESTFFGRGAVAHVSMAQPVCTALARVLATSVEAAAPGVNLHRRGTYVCIEGPQFSSRAESEWYRSMGASVIGMTNMPEAKLAREAQIAYACLAMVTDYDCWHSGAEAVNADMAMANLKKNAENGQQVVRHAIKLIDSDQPLSNAHDALHNALVTPLDSLPPEYRSIVQLLLQ